MILHIIRRSFCFIRFISLTLLFAIIFIFIELIRFIIQDSWPSGLLTILILQLFFGGFTLFSIGIIGEYLGFLIKEISQNPNYVVSKKINI